MTDEWIGFTPILRVTDVELSIRFYCDLLGFQENWIHRFADEFPAYASISRGPLIAHLSEHEGGGTANADLFLGVADVDAIYDEFTKNGLVADPPVSEEAIGLRNFSFTDPDGHQIGFGMGLQQSTESEAE